MPELPEIESLTRELRRAIVGKTITDVHVQQPKMINLPREEYASRVRGQPVIDVRRRGKYTVLTLGEGSIWLHLGLGGQVVVQEAEAGKRGAAVSFVFSDGSELRLERVFMGQAHFLEGAGFDERWNQFGIDPLDQSFTFEHLGKLFASRPRLPVKSLLTEQSLVAGIGNTYADEILFQARIHPATPSGSVSQAELRALHQAIRTVLAEAIEQGGEPDYIALAGQPGRYVKRVHRAERCPRCGGEVEKLTLHGRSTYYCPKCQPAR